MGDQARAIIRGGFAMILRTFVLSAFLAGAACWTYLSEAVPVTPRAPAVSPAPSASASKTPEKKAAVAAKKSLTHYHTAAVQAFAQTPGFGRGRMPTMMEAIEETHVFWSPGELDNDAPLIEVPDLAKVHHERVGFLAGDQKSRPSVPVTISSMHVDGPAQHWRLQSVDLLALVDHQEPTVYITAKLPRLDFNHGAGKKKPGSDEIAKHSRGLDFLEMAALEKLQKGEELFVRTKDGTMRMVGALRAGKACLECHAGKEGDLFGAFSYTLKKVDH